jgi:hypothetical protein
MAAHAEGVAPLDGTIGGAANSVKQRVVRWTRDNCQIDLRLCGTGAGMVCCFCGDAILRRTTATERYLSQSEY